MNNQRQKKMSRVGTVIRCQKCKGVEHNRSSCKKRSATAVASGGQSTTVPLAPAPSAPPTLSLSSTNQSTNNSKRKVPSQTASQKSVGTATVTKKVNSFCHKLYNIELLDIIIWHFSCQCLQSKTLGLAHTKAKARVNTASTGTATVNLNASAATSNVTINIKAGSASAQCSAQQPLKKQQQQKPSTSNAPILFLPPWDSAKLW